MRSKAFKQAPRQQTDGKVHIKRVYDRVGNEHVSISVVTDRHEQTIVCSEYNAARVFGMLSLLFGVRLPKAVGKAIKLDMVYNRMGLRVARARTKGGTPS